MSFRSEIFKLFVLRIVYRVVLRLNTWRLLVASTEAYLTQVALRLVCQPKGGVREWNFLLLLNKCWVYDAEIGPNGADLICVVSDTYIKRICVLRITIWQLYLRLHKRRDLAASPNWRIPGVRIWSNLQAFGLLRKYTWKINGRYLVGEGVWFALQVKIT